MHFLTFSRYALLLCALGTSLNIYPGWKPVVEHKYDHSDLKKAMQELLQEWMEDIDKLVKEHTSEKKQQALTHTITTALNHSVDHLDNKARLLPFYTLGLALLALSMNMNWQALQDYLNGTDQSSSGIEATRSKIKGKLKAGLTLFLAGSGTLFFNRELATFFCGHKPGV